MSIGLTGLGDPLHSPHETERTEEHVNFGFKIERMDHGEVGKK